MLTWDVLDLPKKIGLAEFLIVQAENADGTSRVTLHQARTMQQAFERAGLRFGTGQRIMMIGERQA